jgi:mRNA-degrading endonuclease toxin of MazEF toxin-antitoxin module
MAGVLRGEIRWADLSPAFEYEEAGMRSVLILSQQKRGSGRTV